MGSSEEIRQHVQRHGFVRAGYVLEIGGLPARQKIAFMLAGAGFFLRNDFGGLCLNKTIFIAAIFFLCCQRIAELFVARANEKWMRRNHAQEFGGDNYRWIVLLHVGFILSLIVEGWLTGPAMIGGWQIVAALLGILQVFRYWCIVSLGKFWNTKILVIPGRRLVRTGPYRLFRHPNYGVVVLELLLWPLLFSCWLTLFWAGLANVLALRIRIRQEEQALSLLI